MVVAVCLTLAEACLQSKFHEAHGPNVGRGRRGTIGISRHRLIHAGFFTGFNHGGLSRAPLVEISPLIAAYRGFAATSAAPPARGGIPGEGGGGTEGGPASGMAAIADRASTRAYRDRYRQRFPELSHRAIPGNPVYNWNHSSIILGSPP